MIEKITIEGETALKSKLAKVGKRDLRPFFAIAKTIIWKNTAKRFRDGGGSRGKWAPLSAMTLMTRRFGGSQPLQDSGALMRSVTTQMSVKKESRVELIIGTNMRQASLLQYGYRIPVTSAMRRYFIATQNIYLGVGNELEVPPRPFLYIDSKDKRELNQGLAYYYRSRIKGGA